MKGIELAVGSFDVVHGETTEITNFDNDAFMQGYRVSLKRPHELYLDEVSVTTGYLGDLTTTNVFKRFKWMNDHNYTQVLGAKKLSKSVALRLTGPSSTATARCAKASGSTRSSSAT